MTLKRCVRSPPFGEYGTAGGRKPLRFKRGENHLTGREALGFARVRKNLCAPNEDDRDRAARQQQVLSGIRAQATSPRTFFRAAVGRLGRAADGAQRHAGPRPVGAVRRPDHRRRRARPTCSQPDTLEPFIVSEAERRTEVRRLLGKD